MKIKANNYSPGELMKTIREWTELSQTEFAETVGSTRSGIAKYEHGNRKYTFEKLLQICEIHGITISLEKKR